MLASDLPTLLLFLVLAGSAQALSSKCDAIVNDGQYYGPSNFEKLIFSGDVECVQEYINEGADVNEESRGGTTPAMVAAAQNKVEILKLLLASGAKGDGVTRGYNTPITAAAGSGSLDTLRFLVDAGYSAKVHDPASRACENTAPGSNCPKSEILSILERPIMLVAFDSDFPSNDGILNDGRKDLKATNRECNALCQQTKGCKAWTRIKWTTSGGSKEGECWLRSYQPRAKRCKTCDSGTLDYTLYDNAEYRSDDIIGYNRPAYTEIYSDKLCASLCYANPDCRSWTRIVSDKEYNKAGECWHRYSAPKTYYCKECSSGSIDRY